MSSLVFSYFLDQIKKEELHRKRYKLIGSKKHEKKLKTPTRQGGKSGDTISAM